MTTHYSATTPPTATRQGARRTLNYNVVEMSQEDINALWQADGHEEGTEPDEWYIQEHKYRYNSVTLGGARWTYTGIVEAIIRDKYTIDEMEAITNNMNIIVSEFFEHLVGEGIISATKYLVSSIKGENTAKFKEMQEWRAMAKQIAKEIIKV